jgi:hypothetical protein
MEGSPWVRVALPSSVAELRARVVAALHGLDHRKIGSVLSSDIAGPLFAAVDR